MSTAAHTAHAAAPLSVWWLDAPAPGQAAALRLLAEDASCCWFADPAAGENMLGIGVARDFSKAAAQGPATLARRLRTLRVHAHGAVRHGGALLLGAMPFDPARPAGGAFGAHAAARWVIPRVTFVLRGGVSYCAVAGCNSRADAEALRDAELARLSRAVQQAAHEAAPRTHSDDTNAALESGSLPGDNAPASSHAPATSVPLPINLAPGVAAATEPGSPSAPPPHEAASRTHSDDTPVALESGSLPGDNAPASSHAPATSVPLPINVAPGVAAATEPGSPSAPPPHEAAPRTHSDDTNAALESGSLPGDNAPASSHAPATSVSLPINVAPGVAAATEPGSPSASPAHEAASRAHSDDTPVAPESNASPAHTTPRTSPPPAFEETPEAFRARVAAALEAVARGALHKVVPARARCIRAQHPFDPARVAQRLFAAEPHALHYAVPLPAGLLLGATPERLLRVAGERVLVDALAGTIRRGHTEQADAAAKQSLCESKKDQEEHAWTRAAIHRALAAHLQALEYPEAPRVLSTSGLHHLHTPFVGRRHGSSPGALELAARLHPTPAVAGAPRAAALAWLGAHEPLARGAYAGPVGWVDLAGDGALGVALRCALLQGERAVLFAGAGVVAGSQPAAEFEETQLKLRTMEAALLGE